MAPVHAARNTTYVVYVLRVEPFQQAVSRLRVRDWSPSCWGEFSIPVQKNASIPRANGGIIMFPSSNSVLRALW